MDACSNKKLAGFHKNNLRRYAAPLPSAKNRWFFIYNFLWVTFFKRRYIVLTYHSKENKMKKLLFTAFIAGSLIACNSGSKENENAKDSTVNTIENTTDSMQSQVQENADSAKARLERSSDSAKNKVKDKFEKKDSLQKK
jgi:hypothetical protein